MSSFIEASPLFEEFLVEGSIFEGVLYLKGCQVWFKYQHVQRGCSGTFILFIHS